MIAVTGLTINFAEFALFANNDVHEVEHNRGGVFQIDEVTAAHG